MILLLLPPVPHIFIVKTRVADKAHYNVSQLVSSIPTQYKNKLKVKLYRYLFNQDANKASVCDSLDLFETFSNQLNKSSCIGTYSIKMLIRQ